MFTALTLFLITKFFAEVRKGTGERTRFAIFVLYALTIFAIVMGIFEDMGVMHFLTRG